MRNIRPFFASIICILLTVLSSACVSSVANTSTMSLHELVCDLGKPELDDPESSFISHGDCPADRAQDELVSRRDPRSVPMLVGVVMQTNESWSARSRAIFVLGELRDRRATAPLVSLLTDERYNHWVVTALSQIGDFQASSPMIRILENTDQDDILRYHVAVRLGMLGDENAKTSLTRIAISPKQDNLVREGALKGLGHLGGADVAALLTNVLKDAESVSMRRAAAEALGSAKHPSSVPALIQALEDKHVRLTAAKSLGSVGDLRAVKPLIDLLMQHGQGDDFPGTSVKYTASTALGQLGDPRAIPALVETIRKDPRPRYFKAWDGMAGLEVRSDWRFWQAPYTALEDLTGEKFDGDSQKKSWLEWWSRNKQKYQGQITKE